MILNLSTNKKYFSQRDNIVRPLATCCSTAIAMALTYSGISNLPSYQGQLEDTLTNFANTDSRVVEHYRNHKEGWIRQEFRRGRPANEIHEVMYFAVNTWVGRNVVSFNYRTPLEEMVSSLLDGRACVLSGNFLSKRSNGEIVSIGHVICLVGFETSQENIEPTNIDKSKIINFIVDDSYGNYKTFYVDRNGNDIVMPMVDFMKYIKAPNTDRKWCYQFNR